MQKVFKIMDNGVAEKYVVLDYSDILRFAVPLTEIPALFGVEITDKSDETIIYEATKALQKKGASNNKSFIAVQQHYAEKIITLFEKNEAQDDWLSIKKPIRFTFYVRPDSEGNMGIRGASSNFAKHSLDDVYSLPLQVNIGMFNKGYENSADEDDAFNQVRTVHELIHNLHGAYFNLELGWVCEGFAEMVPYYLMDKEPEDPLHHNTVMNIPKDDMLSLNFIQKFGCFALGQREKQAVQDLKTYQSMYLWMVGYTQRVEQKYGLSKLNATKLILKQFSAIAKLPDHQMKNKWLAGFIGIPVEDILTGKTLQQEGQNAIIKRVQDYYQAKGLTLSGTDKTDYTQMKHNIVDYVQNAEGFERLGHIGLLFQNVVPYYLGIQKGPLTQSGKEMCDILEKFRKHYQLTKSDTVVTIQIQFKQFLNSERYKQDDETKFQNIAGLFSTHEHNPVIDVMQIEKLWNTPVQQRQEKSIQQKRKASSR